MTVLIKAIVLYSHQGEQRVVPFSTGLNVITGDSKTGKSAIIDIIDYCLGRAHCNVAEGVVRRTVSWFGLQLQRGDDTVFIARKNPGPGTDTGGDIYVRRGQFAEPPALEELQKNIVGNELEMLLSRFIGIAENQHRPVSGTRLPLEATIRHALFLCFQKQDEIDNRERLFHRQGDPFIPQAIKDTLPYFLGAVSEDHFLRQYELDQALETLRKLEQSIAQAKTQRELDFGRIRRLVNEAKRVGLLPQDYEPVVAALDEVISRLERVGRTELLSDRSIPDFGVTIERLRGEQSNLRQLLAQASDDVRAARLFMSEHTSFHREANEQRSRLSAIGLLEGEPDGDRCPLCESMLTTPAPTARQLVAALRQIDTQLDAVEVEQPHLQKHIEGLEARRQRLERELVEAQAALSRAIADDELAKAQQDMLLERARIVGRIGSFLESVRNPEVEVDFSQQLQTARARVSLLEALVNVDEIAQRVDTYLNIISKQMSEYATSLDLEHSESTLRLDLKKLTVVADTEEGPIPLTRMGSGENWVGYHVLAHLALHWWFRKRKRPVPGFLIFDQPSQAHYPAERDQDGRLDPLDDKDRHAVHALFDLMHRGCSTMEGDFQIIVLDHAHLDDAWFEDAIVEEWRRGNALVPPEWEAAA